MGFDPDQPCPWWLLPESESTEPMAPWHAAKRERALRFIQALAWVAYQGRKFHELATNWLSVEGDPDCRARLPHFPDLYGVGLMCSFSMGFSHTLNVFPWEISSRPSIRSIAGDGTLTGVRWLIEIAKGMFERWGLCEASDYSLDTNSLPSTNLKELRALREALDLIGLSPEQAADLVVFGDGEEVDPKGEDCERGEAWHESEVVGGGGQQAENVVMTLREAFSTWRPDARRNDPPPASSAGCEVHRAGQECEVGQIDEDATLYRKTAAELRKANKCTVAKLIEYMENKEYADHQAVEREVHGGRKVSNEAIRGNVNRANRALEHHAAPYLFRVAGGRVYKERRWSIGAQAPGNGDESQK